MNLSILGLFLIKIISLSRASCTSAHCYPDCGMVERFRLKSKTDLACEQQHTRSLWVAYGSGQRTETRTRNAIHFRFSNPMHSHSRPSSQTEPKCGTVVYQVALGRITKFTWRLVNWATLIVIHVLIFSCNISFIFFNFRQDQFFVVCMF